MKVSFMATYTSCQIHVQGGKYTKHLLIVSARAVSGIPGTE